ncbi:MAG TPA: hypothetical protein VFL96_14865, partial [Acidobacteriaceae bacterium]|nr:hypothetical protein [Acidobacteriaceae bacterium]
MAAPERNRRESAARFTASGSSDDSNPAADKRPPCGTRLPRVQSSVACAYGTKGNSSGLLAQAKLADDFAIPIGVVGL